MCLQITLEMYCWKKKLIIRQWFWNPLYDSILKQILYLPIVSELYPVSHFSLSLSLSLSFSLSLFLSPSLFAFLSLYVCLFLFLKLAFLFIAVYLPFLLPTQRTTSTSFSSLFVRMPQSCLIIHLSFSFIHFFGVNVKNV